MLQSLQKSNRTDLLNVVLAFAAIYVVWGTTYLAISIAVETIPPFFMAGARFLTAGFITFFFLRMRGVPMPTRREWRSAAIIGALLLVGGNGLVSWAEQQIPSGIAALIVATVPLWMAVFGWLIYRQRRPGVQTVAGLFLGLVGIVLLVGPAQLAGDASFDLISLLVLLLSPVLWSLGSLYSRQAVLPKNVLMATAMEMLAGGVMLMVVGLTMGEATQLDLALISTRSFLSLLYLIVFGSIVAFTAYVWLLKHVQPARVATYTYVNPVIAVFLGWLILSEPVTLQTIIAVVVILAAVVMISTQKEKKEPPAVPAQTDKPPQLPASGASAPNAAVPGD